MGRFVQWGNFSFEQARVCGQLELEPPSPFHYSLGRRLSLTLNYGEVGWGKTSTQIRERCCPNSYHGAIWLSWGIRHAHNIKNDLHLVLSVLRLKVDTDLFSFFFFFFFFTEPFCFIFWSFIPWVWENASHWIRLMYSRFLVFPPPMGYWGRRDERLLFWKPRKNLKRGWLLAF